MQHLILPLQTCKVTANYQNEPYATAYGYTHYGTDYADGREIIASGFGMVLASDYDDRLGGTLVIYYPEAYHHDGTVADVIFRYNHLEERYVYAGQIVSMGDALGLTGQTPLGRINGIHLHIEADSDIDYPLHTPSLATNSNLLQAGLRGERDTSFSVAEVLHIGEGQSIYRATPLDDWTCDADCQLPPYEGESVEERIEILVRIVTMLSALLGDALEEIA